MKRRQLEGVVVVDVDVANERESFFFLYKLKTSFGFSLTKVI